MSKREEKKETGEDVELESAETLLSRLRRQYRMMERNRRQYRDEATVLLGRQRTKSVLNQWKHLCCRVDKLNPATARVCSRHFKVADYNQKYILTKQLLNKSPQATRSLKEDAVPSLFLPNQGEDSELAPDSYEAPTQTSAVGETLLTPRELETTKEGSSASSGGHNLAVCWSCCGFLHSGNNKVYALQQQLSEVSLRLEKIAEIERQLKLNLEELQAEEGSLEQRLMVLVGENNDIKKKLLKQSLDNDILLKENTEYKNLISKYNLEKAKQSYANKPITAFHEEVEKHMRDILSPFFSDTQISFFLTGESVRKWSDEDIAQALTLKSVISPNGYHYLREQLKLPMPSVSTLQRKILRDLQKEKDDLESHLSAMATVQNETKDHRTIHTLSATLDRQSDYQEQIEQEKDKIRELDTNITVAEKKLRESRRRVPSARQLESRRLAALNATKALQNRIQQATVRLNAVLADNRVLRTNLENLLKQRDKFLLQAQRLEKQLQATTKKKSDIMDQVTKAYSERDEAQTKMRALKERAERDAQQYSHELKKLQRAVDHQNHLRAFVATISAGEEDETAQRRPEGEGGEPRGPEQTLATYRASVSHLREMSGEESVEALVTNYLQAENDNYTLFTYISDLNNEVTSLSSEVRRLSQMIEDTKGRSEEQGRESQRTVSKLESEVESAEVALEVLEGELKIAEDTLTEMKTATHELFEMLQCDPQPIIAIVGGGEITSGSVSVYLSVVEQRIHELLQLHQFMLSEDLPPHLASLAEVEGHDEANEGRSSSASSAKVVVPLGKPQLTHTPHTNDEESPNGNPFTHGDLLANMRKCIPDSPDD
ncbi:hypothetical protein Pmani_029402 [Petrolisthes manimaculis]|uniref:Uncharacterized protein n=1 Tax=Petrolisthes manimaculis TaxID=1843537 RepID=A0AAE1NZF6_9EUCA|nr:hypothetical protein Pmani_029402 [Petrolisthes manimaculis]